MPPHGGFWGGARAQVSSWPAGCKLVDVPRYYTPVQKKDVLKDVVKALPSQHQYLFGVRPSILEPISK